MTRGDLARGVVITVAVGLGIVLGLVARMAAQPAHALVAQQCVSPALATQTARERDEWKQKAIGLLETCGKVKPTRTPIARVD